MISEYLGLKSAIGWEALIGGEEIVGVGEGCGWYTEATEVTEKLAALVPAVHICRMQIVLASASPRRRELLERAGVVFEVVASPAEEIHDASMKPEVLCEWNAVLKAEAVALTLPHAVVIGADTLVFIDDIPLGKPADLDEARRMLRCLAGRTHRVCTGVCVIFPDGEKRTFHDTTEVTFLPLDDTAIENYLQVSNPLDKAGAYGIQESGDMIVSRISGSYENVMGLPVEMVVAAFATKSGCETGGNG